MMETERTDAGRRKWNFGDVRRLAGTAGTILFIIAVQALIALLALVLLVLGPAIVLVLVLIAVSTCAWETYKNRRHC